jgi:CheY-like chemotaxis protein
MKHTVLVVEDDVDLREMLRDLLELEGFHTVGASEGGEALSALPTIEHVCVVVLDLLMPGMNGWDFFDALKSSPHYAETPVIVTTSAPNRAPAGATAVMAKPVDVERLLAAVQAYCA